MLEHTRAEVVPLGIGCYSVPEAARLIKTSPRNLKRWLGGYTYRGPGGDEAYVPPLWRPQLPGADGEFELGFRDLIELRFVLAFAREGLGLKAIRGCLEHAQKIVGDERPFSTRGFRSEGRTILLDSLGQFQETDRLDLKRQQSIFRQAVELSFRDLDVEAEAVARWRPFQGKPSIVLDPARAFGTPIAAGFGVPTRVLADTAMAEGTPEQAASLFELPVAVVRDAIKFEEFLAVA